MSNHALETLDANCVAKRLWVGAAPPTDRDLPQFQALVLCAVEYQPEFPFYRGAILRCRLRDSNLSRFEADHALVGGQWVATALSNGKTVLVTCQAGINRSALVASVALGMLNRRATPEQIMDRIRRTRNPDCLSNPDFQRFLKQYLKR
ncbi:MAG TPA: dual specificity protein phosphatase [Galbitalea sp.]|jgi:protein-tyrosine phosphatase